MTLFNDDANAETEPLDAGHEPVPADLLELFEVIEYDNAKVIEADHKLETKRLGERVREASSLRLVSRHEWGARDARSVSTNIKPREMACHYEGPHLGEFPHDSCATKVKGIQAYHMDKNGWADIAYSYMVCPHGFVFEGRGPGKRTAANGTTDGNTYAYATCFLGGVNDFFTAEAKDGFWSAARLLGVDDAPWRPHQYYFNTACPGIAIAAWVKLGHKSDGQVPAPLPPVTPSMDDFKRRVMAKAVLEEGAGAPGGGRDNQAQDVRIMQGLMLAHGAIPISESGQIDGRFSNITRQGLTAWQKRTKALPADGRCDADDWAWFVGV